ncbi:MAG: hypothetical protein ACKV0T_20635 [Planctomycetales bacterium]
MENTGPGLSLGAPRPLEVEGTPIQMPEAPLHPVFADWNRDGLGDLLLGMPSGSVVVYMNSGRRRDPRLSMPRIVVEAGDRRWRMVGDAPSRGLGGNFCVADWDSDGVLDLLIGDEQMTKIEPDPSDLADELKTARQAAARVLSEYRRLRALSNRLDQKSQEKQREFVLQSRATTGARLEELNAQIARIEKSMQPRLEWHSYVWLLRRLISQD